MTDSGDRRRTLCKKWVQLDGRRTPCSFAREHEGPHSWDVFYPSDGDEMRDVGPFEDGEQAMRQFANWSAGLLMPEAHSAVLSLMEGALLAGIVATDFEREYITQHGLDPVLATILSGWLIRASHDPSARSRASRQKP